MKGKHFPRYWPFVRGIHRSPVNSPHKGQWRGALIFSLICVWINGWVNNHEAGDLRRYRAHHDVTVFWWSHDVEMLSASLVHCEGNPRKMAPPMPLNHHYFRFSTTKVNCWLRMGHILCFWTYVDTSCMADAFFHLLYGMLSTFPLFMLVHVENNHLV